MPNEISVLRTVRINVALGDHYPGASEVQSGRGLVDEGKRWLKDRDAATYVGVRVDQLRRYVSTGKLPAPSYHLGLKSPRWDRLALDRILDGKFRTWRGRWKPASPKPGHQV